MLTTGAAAGVGVPAIFGICLVQDRVRRHRPDTMTTSDVEVALSSRPQMRRLLGTAGAVIGLAVLASGALRLATVPDYLDQSAFPATAVLLYGAFFTGLLVLVYVPAHLSLRRFCVDIREHYFPVAGMPPPTSPDFAGWVEGRARLDTLTQVNVTTGQQLQASVFILAPPRVRCAGCPGAASCMTAGDSWWRSSPPCPCSTHAREESPSSLTAWRRRQRNWAILAAGPTPEHRYVPVNQARDDHAAGQVSMHSNEETGRPC